MPPSPAPADAAKAAALPLPPADLMRIVGSDSAENFVAVGRATLSLLRRHGGLKPSDRVLDVGCGCGRLARPLARYLDSGSYEGFDVIPELVDWCRRNITQRRPDFRFELVNVANSFYRCEGAVPASRFRFPHADGAFDFAILTSVFTHMLRRDLEHYVDEVARTLKPGGTVLMTFFLLNEESRLLKETSKSAYRFWDWHPGGVRLRNRRSPESAVAYPEALARLILRRRGLQLREVLYGSWCGRDGAENGQDIVIARKALPGEEADPAPKRWARTLAGQIQRRRDGIRFLLRKR